MNDFLFETRITSLVKIFKSHGNSFVVASFYCFLPEYTYFKPFAFYIPISKFKVIIHNDFASFADLSKILVKYYVFR